VKAAPTDTLCRVGVTKLSYIGQRVEIEDAGCDECAGFEAAASARGGHGGA